MPLSNFVPISGQNVNNESYAQRFKKLALIKTQVFHKLTLKFMKLLGTTKRRLCFLDVIYAMRVFRRHFGIF